MLAGFPDGRVDEGPGAGHASLVGLELARENGWTAPDGGGEGTRQRHRRDQAGAAEQADASREPRPRPSRKREVMIDTLTPVLTDNWDAERAWKLATYEDRGGYGALKTALGMAPDDLIELVKDSGLRGRGGAGFPDRHEVVVHPAGQPKPKYLVVNADESEPGTCKDIPLMMANPHTLVEGVIISSFAIRANPAFIYIRGEVLHVSAGCRPPSRRRTPPATSARTSTARATTSTSSSTPAPAPTSAARRRRCSTRSRVAAASRGCARRSPRSPASTPARP